jgi:plastocyanin
MICLLVVLVLVGCGGSSGGPVVAGLATATTAAASVVPTAAPTATATAVPSPTTVATPTAMQGHASMVPSAAPVVSPTVVAEPTATGVPGQAAVEVRIIDFAFDPPLLEVPVGTTVVWRLVEGYHTVASADFRLNSPILENVGDSYSYTFTEAGIYDYICGIHPDMLGVVQVVP